MKKVKQIIAFALTAVMMTSLFPSSIMADEQETPEIEITAEEEISAEEEVEAEKEIKAEEKIVTEEDDNSADLAASYTYTYDRNAVPLDKDRLPGVYTVKAVAGDKKESTKLGMPSIAKQNLESAPTTESPAIIQGAAVPFEKRADIGGEIHFDKLTDDPVCAPYSYFRYELVEEANTGTTPEGASHTKITGFDGTFVILRIDVSDIIKNAPAGSYLHVKQTDNKAMYVLYGQGALTNKADGTLSSVSFSDSKGARVGCYSLDDAAASLKDKDGYYQDTPYVDLIMVSSGSIVAGADKGKTNAPPADFPVTMYVDQTPDYNPEIIWDEATKSILNRDTREAVAGTTDASGNKITPDMMMLDKYYDESKSGGALVTGYTIKGDDLELEVTVDESEGGNSTPAEYWSLRRAMAYNAYNSHTIKLMCEVPVLQGLLLEGQGRDVILDVNSFDIQLANHTDTNAAGLTVRDGAKLTIADHSNTTGAELAVGNNATMLVETGGKLEIDRTCQLEVEYDSASTAVPAEGETPPPTEELNYGVIRIVNGGEVINNGVITVEGAEGKAQDATETIIRDYKDAKLTVGEGGTLTNHGCILVNGSLYNLGTIVNDGKYDVDPIISTDPDKGNFTYHRGIQLSWKDDVTQGKTSCGYLTVGIDDDEMKYPDAKLVNSGDIVAIPGYILNCSTIENTGNIFLTAVDEVIIPIVASQDQSTVVEKKIQLGYFETSALVNERGATLLNGAGGCIRTADFEIKSNGRTGDKTRDISSDYKEIDVLNIGDLENAGNISVYRIDNSGIVKNSGTMGGTFGSETAQTAVILLDSMNSTGSFEDSAATKIQTVYNGSRTAGTGSDKWSYAKLKKLTVTTDEENKKFDVTAIPVSEGEDISYLIETVLDNDDTIVSTDAVRAGETITITPDIEGKSGERIYRFDAVGTGISAAGAVDAGDPGVDRPTAMQNLVYDSTAQNLVTVGESSKGTLQYSLDNITWTQTIPQATNAGTYKVYYRVADNTGAAIEGLGGSVDVVIARRDLYLAADDKGTRKGEALKELTYTAYGLMDADKNSVTVSAPTVDGNTAGVYDINISITDAAAANYNTVDEGGASRITGGKYFVSDRFLNLDIKSNMGGYHNMNQSVVITAAKYKRDETKTTETVANIYYSEKMPLTAENYKSKDATVGATTIAPSYAAVGTNALVYYYVELPATDTAQVTGFGGSQRIVINKGDQLQPGLEGQKVGVDNTVNPPKDIMGVLEAVRAYKGGKGEILGLQCPGKDATTTHPMEYRRSDSDKYIPATDVVAYVPAGTYYVRFTADEHYNAGPDTEVIVEDGSGYTAVFYNYDNSIFHKTEDGTISYGQKINKPDKDPERPDGAKFRAWQSNGEDYDFSQPYIGGYEVSNGVVSFYPDWEVSKHTVTFRMNGGGADRTVEVEDGTSVAKPTDPKYTGHTFLGWKLGDADYDFSSKVTADITLDASWKTNSATIRYVANGGRGVMADTSVEYDQTVKLRPVTFTRDECTFMNWNTASNGSGDIYADGADFRNSEAADGKVINLYAQWRKSLDSKDITVSVAGSEYNGQAQKPAVNVYDNKPGGKVDITGYCNIEYYDNVNAGTAYVIVKPTGSAPYTGEKRQNFTIDKAPVTLQGTSTGRSFIPGNKIVDVDLSIKSGVIEADKPYVLLSPAMATASMSDPNAGENKKAVIDLENVTLTGDKAGNYYIAGADQVNVTISPGTYGDVMLGTQRYLSTEDKVSGKMELVFLLLEDFGLSEFDTNSVCTGIVESATVDEAGTLKYTVAAGAGSGSVTSTLHTANYGDIKYILDVEKTDIALYEKSGEVCTNKVLPEGQKFSLEARFSSAVTDKRIIWESSDPAVASVEDGTVTGISKGTTKIKAINPETGMSAECFVIVWDQVEELIVEPTRLTLGVGETAEISSLSLPYYSAQVVAWESSDEKIVDFVYGTGDTITVKGISAGKATITASVYDDSGKKAKISVTVGTPASGLTVGTKGNTSDVAVGKKLTMTANFAVKPANKDVKWSLSTTDGKNPADIATITEKGVLTGVSEGVVRVTATSVSNPSITNTKDITVYVPIKKAKLNITSGTISTAESANGLDLSVDITPAVAKDSPAGTSATGINLGTDPTITYSVDPKFADYLNVDATTGMVTEKGKTAKNIPVYANIKAYGGYDKTLTCKVTVTDKANPLKKVKFTKSSVVLGTGKQGYLDAVMTPINPDGVISVGLADNTDPSVASYVKSVISQGHILTSIEAGDKPGETTMTLAVTSSAGTANIKCKVKVLPSVSAISFKNVDADKEHRLAVGKSLTLKPEFTLSSEGKKAANTDLVWTSSDPGIATVSSKGAVKAVAPGTVTITATCASDGSVSRTVPFKVYTPVKKLKADRKKLTIGSNELTMNCYGKIMVPEIYLPDNDTGIEWTADNAGVALARISQDTPAMNAVYGAAGAPVTVAKGEMLAVKGLVPGVTKLTGTATDGSGKKVTVHVTVRGTVTQMIVSDDLTVKSGGSVKITPELTINGRTSADKKEYNTYKKYTDLTVTYWSSSADITVDRKGKVSAKRGTAAGTKAVITVRSADGKVSMSVNVTVQ